MKKQIEELYKDLGFDWSQTLKDVTITIPTEGKRGRDVSYKLTPTSLTVGWKGATPLIDGKLHKKVKAEDCSWSIDSEEGILTIELEKINKMEWWSCIVEGQPKIDTSKIEPESSSISDIEDPETKAMVAKMLYDNKQKQMGLPTSEEQKKQDAIKQFMAAHPEMDFSKAKFSE